MSAIDYVPTYSDIDHRLMNTLGDLMDKTINYLSSSLSGPLTASCIIYIAFIGYNIMYGRSSISLWDFIATTVKLAIVVTLTTNASQYNAWIKDIFFTDLPNAIANVTQGAHSDKNVWDNMMAHASAHVFDAANKYNGWTEVGTYIVNWIAGLICLLIAAFLALLPLSLQCLQNLVHFLSYQLDHFL